MTPLSKCLLLPIDGTEEALRPVEFLTRLYPDLSQVSIILGYFSAPLPPAYQEKSTSPEFIKKRQELRRSREHNVRSALEQAKKVLTRAGFLSHTIEEHIQEKQASKAKEACLLADRKKVDAVLVQKRVSSALEGFLRNDSTHGLIVHCITSPIWLTDGAADASHVAVCITDESASLRAVDHAAFMLSGTGVRITLLHAARTISHPASSSASFIKADLEKWLMTPEGRRMKPFFMESHGILNSEGIGDERIGITVIPSHGKIASEILSYCREQGIGIVVLGHSRPTGIKDFLKGSVTKRVLAELKNMTVWVNQ
jgi:nucleotide-binding universal stress UspA family protein